MSRFNNIGNLSVEELEEGVGAGGDPSKGDVDLTGVGTDLPAVAEIADDADKITDAIRATAEDAEDLEGLQDSIEPTGDGDGDADEGISAESYRAIMVTAERLRRKGVTGIHRALGYSRAGESRGFYASEARGMTTRSDRVMKRRAIESGIWDSLVGLWEKAVALAKRLWAYIKSKLKELFTKTGRLGAAAKALEEEARRRRIAKEDGEKTFKDDSINEAFGTSKAVATAASCKTILNVHRDITTAAISYVKDISAKSNTFDSISKTGVDVMKSHMGGNNKKSNDNSVMFKHAVDTVNTEIKTFVKDTILGKAESLKLASKMGGSADEEALIKNLGLTKGEVKNLYASALMVGQERLLLVDETEQSNQTKQIERVNIRFAMSRVHVDDDDLDENAELDAMSSEEVKQIAGIVVVLAEQTAKLNGCVDDADKLNTKAEKAFNTFTKELKAIDMEAIKNAAPNTGNDKAFATDGKELLRDVLNTGRDLLRAATSAMKECVTAIPAKNMVAGHAALAFGKRSLNVRYK